MAAASETVGKEFVIERVFDAPRDLVWEAFTRAEHLKHWWGPKGFKIFHCQIDLRPGGIFHYGMQSPTGNEMWGKWIFREIVRPERLAYAFSFSDKDGGLTRHPMAPTWPAEMLGTTTFIAQGGKTLLRNTASALNPTEEERETFEAGFAGMDAGFNATWDQLAAYLPKMA